MDYRVWKVPFSGQQPRSLQRDVDGMVKFVRMQKTIAFWRHILQHAASELIAEAVSVIEFGGQLGDIGRTCHSHPTLSEAAEKQALNVEKRVVAHRQPLNLQPGSLDASANEFD